MGAVSRLFFLLLIVPMDGVLAADVDHSIRDTAARIDYGFYTEDLSLIVAARSAIADSSSNPWMDYLRAYASYRAAQVSIALARPVGRTIDECVAAAEEAADSTETEAEANVLIAACAALAASAEPLRSVLHQRRFRRAADRAHTLEPDNPRLLLITYTMPDSADPESIPEAKKLVDAFLTRRDAFAFPDWGEAEALTAVGAAHLELGDRRGARDFVEEALLRAPDYLGALKLEARISYQVTQH